jgi:hypothetical protein
VDAVGDEGRLLGGGPGLLVEVRGGAGVEGAAIGTAERARVDRRVGAQFVGDLTALPDPDQAAADGVGDPQRALSVEAGTVGRDGGVGQRLIERAVGWQRAELSPGAADDAVAPGTGGRSSTSGPRSPGRPRGTSCSCSSWTEPK